MTKRRHASETTVLRRNGYCHNHGGRPCPKIRFQAAPPEPEPSPSLVALGAVIGSVLLFASLFSAFVLMGAAR